MRTLVRVFEQAGGYGMHLAGTLTAQVAMLRDTVLSFMRLDRRRLASAERQIVSQILFTGVEALGLVAIVALLCGITIVIQAMNNMPRFGASEYFGNIMIIVVVRELGPLFTSLVIIGRSGSALATYIGNMRVRKEISSLEVMGIDPLHFIVIPAFMGMMISMVALSVYFDIVAIIGGLLVALLTVNVPFGIFITKVLQALTVTDILVSVWKNVLFGQIIAIVSCYTGLQVTNEREVPKAARNSVVTSMVTVMVLNVFVTLAFYG